ncbi:MAG: tRNA (adenosine(37)-N6)-dimethylallyltransferase MiaA [Verrucomicrobia bacterium]|nr:tRNA (adenosine(37)-N6)-dimethylallyltransferase MiaA [Verrucomicrobiota bacterium]
MKSPPRLLLLAGPTAVGKSDVALVLAERFGGEIVSVDSMQVYRGLDIGTAKPSPEDRRRVPHHLVDVLELHERFDAARFVALARQAVRDIQARGRLPVLCGGTGLYFQAFLAGLGSAPGPNPALRAELEATPMPALLRELQQRDPATFQRIDRQNPRRVIRALEVIRQTPQPLASQRAPWPAPPAPGPGTPTFFGLARQPADLRARIHRRVDGMFARGLVAETRRLLAAGLADNPVALQALGYRQAVEHIRGQYTLADTIGRVKTRTWQFARRQMTWFRHQARLCWLHVDPEETPAAVADRIAAVWK